jgi:hypothetical protein
MPAFRISFAKPSNKLCPVCQLQADRLSSWCTPFRRLAAHPARDLLVRQRKLQSFAPSYQRYAADRSTVAN